MKKLAIFASGSGSNAENIITHLKKSNLKTEFLILTNNPNAKVLVRAKKLNVEAVVFDKTELLNGTVLEKLMSFQPDLIILAGFLLLLPVTIINAFPHKIINIHPSLLPKYGGKGMYGINVHNAILENKEAQTGITIHYVNENYDDGTFIFQKSVSILDCMTSEMIVEKIQVLEMKHFPQVIFELLQ